MTKIWKTSPAWAVHRGTTMAGSRHHRTCCFDAGYHAARAEQAKPATTSEASHASSANAQAERDVIDAAMALEAEWIGTYDSRNECLSCGRARSQVNAHGKHDQGCKIEPFLRAVQALAASEGEK